MCGFSPFPSVHACQNYHPSQCHRVPSTKAFILGPHMSRELRERDEMFYTSWSQATEVNINNSCVLLHFLKLFLKTFVFSCGLNLPLVLLKMRTKNLFDCNLWSTGSVDFSRLKEDLCIILETWLDFISVRLTFTNKIFFKYVHRTQCTFIKTNLHDSVFVSPNCLLMSCSHLINTSFFRLCRVATLPKNIYNWTHWFSGAVKELFSLNHFESESRLWCRRNVRQVQL